MKREVIDCVNNRIYTEEIEETYMGVPVAQPVIDKLREQAELEKNAEMIDRLCKELNVPHRVLVGQPPPPAKFRGNSALTFCKGDYKITIDFPHSPGMSMKKVQDFWSLQLDHFIEYCKNPIKAQGEEYVLDQPIIKEANEDGTKSSSNG